MDGRWKLENYEGKQRKIGLNGRNQGGMGDIDSASFRGLPWTSAACVDGRWKMGNYEGEQRKNGINGRNQGGEGGIFLPSTSVRFRGHPRHVRTADGRWKLGNYEENSEKLA